MVKFFIISETYMDTHDAYTTWITEKSSIDEVEDYIQNVSNEDIVCVIKGDKLQEYE